MTERHLGLVETDKTPYLKAARLAQDEYMDAYVNLLRKIAAARDAGCSWLAIGQEFGISPQAAHQKWAGEIGQLDRTWGREGSEEVVKNEAIVKAVLARKARQRRR